MIERITTEYPDFDDLKYTVNLLVDAVNDLTTNLDGQARTLIEQQYKIAILEEHAHPTAKTEPTDPYAEQRKWIGCLVRYKICDWQGGWNTDVLDEIVDHPIYPFKMRNGDTAAVCEVVEPSEIYPNKARTW